MTKHYVSTYTNGSIGLSTHSVSSIATLTGAGGEYSGEWAAREIRLRTKPAGLSWPVSLVTEWANAFTHGGLTEQGAAALLQRMADATVERDLGLVSTGTHLVESAKIPQDLYFRGAWAYHANKIVIDMALARGIHMDMIRVSRNAKLIELDVAYIRAVEGHDTAKQSEIRHEKRRLRDIPQEFDLNVFPNEPEALLKLWPDNLDRPGV